MTPKWDKMKMSETKKIKNKRLVTFYMNTFQQIVLTLPQTQISLTGPKDTENAVKQKCHGKKGKLRK